MIAQILFKPKGFCLLVFCFIFGLAHTQTFNKTYSNNGSDVCFNIVETSDGFKSLNSTFKQGGVKLSFSSYSKSGTRNFDTVYGTSTEVLSFYSFLLSKDSNYFSGAYNYDLAKDSSYCTIIKFSDNGQALFVKKKVAPPGQLYYANYMIKTKLDEFIISGQIGDTSVTDGNMFILKTDTMGNFLWQSEFGGTRWDHAYSSIELPDASILTLGWTRSFGFGNNSNRDVLLVKWDSLGNKLWHKTFGSPVTEGGIGISATKDGNYLLACTQYDPNTSIENPWIIKVDTGGNIVWQTKVPIVGMCNPWWAKETSTGDIVSAGSCRNPNNNLDEGSIFLLDSVGNLKWERSFAQGNDHAYFRDVIETSDKGFICAGFCFEGASGGQDAWLVKLDSAGCDSAGCAIYTALPPSPLSNGEGPGVRLFPNPAKEIFYIKFPHAFFADTYTVTVTNMQGQVLLNQKYVYNLRQDMPIFVNNLASGMYLVTIKVDDKTYVSKLIIEK